MALGTFIDTRTISIAATASATLTHGLARQPHMVWGVAKFRSTVWTTASSLPYFTATANTASVTCFNRGELAETFSVFTVFLHSLIS